MQVKTLPFNTSYYDMLQRTFPSPEAFKRFLFGLADVAVILGTLLLLALVAEARRRNTDERGRYVDFTSG